MDADNFDPKNQEVTADNLLKNPEVDSPDKAEKDEPADIFLWANNLVEYIEELKIDLYLFSKKQIVYRVKLDSAADRQLRPLFIDNILEYVLDGIDTGLIVRSFEEAAKEDNVLQRTRIGNVDKFMEVRRWLTSEQHNIEEFDDNEHDMSKMRGVVAVCSHPKHNAFYVIKSLPTSQVMKGHTAWLMKNSEFKPFEGGLAAIKIPGENQLLVIDRDMFVFNESKLKSIFGYDAKAAYIASKKVAEIEANFKLSFADGVNLQMLVKGRSATIKKLQKIEPSMVKQDDLVSHAETMGVELMTDESGSIIIMDEKDLVRFVNLLNDDYVESNMTGERYEIINKRPLKPANSEE